MDFSQNHNNNFIFLIILEEKIYNINMLYQIFKIFHHLPLHWNM